MPTARHKRAKEPRTIFERVLAAMQEAEEIGGPEGDEYVALMNQIATEALRRQAAFLANKNAEWEG